jgi:hypothetical protein
MRILLSFVFVVLLQLNLYSQGDTSKVITATRFGDYFISNHEFIHGNIVRVKYPNTHPMNCTQSDSLITVCDSQGKVLFTESFPLDEATEVTLFADTMSFCGLGTLLTYQYEVSPNYGNCTTDMQFFGYNAAGEFVPFTGFIPVCDGTKPQIKWVKSTKKMNTGQIELDCPGEEDTLVPYLVVRHETDFCEVSVVDYYKIALDGLKNTKDYAAEKMEQQPIFVNDTLLNTLKFDETTLSTLRLALYAKPSLSSSKKKVIFRQSNSLKFHFGTQTNANSWIFVRINGVVGYMLLEDLEKLGFEKCER